MIRHITIKGFRGMAGTHTFAPSNLTIVTGRNGLGKTTFFDAIDWCLFGGASRFGPRPELIRNLYVHDAEPEVEVTLLLGQREVTITRTLDAVKINGLASSERDLGETLIVDPGVFPPYLRDLSKQVRTVTYLPQEAIREFVNVSLTSERKALLRGLLGVPNAGLLDSSINRVRDHFSGRERTLFEEIEELEREVQEVSGVEFDADVDNDAREFIDSVRSRYGVHFSSVEAARTAVEQELSTHKRAEHALGRLVIEYEATSNALQQASREIEEVQRVRAERCAHLTLATDKSVSGAASIEAAVLAHQEAVRGAAERATASARLSGLIAALRRRAQLSADLQKCDADLVRLNIDREQANARLRSLQDDLVKGTESLSKLEIRVSRARERKQVEEGRVALGQEERQLRARQEALEAQLAEAQKAKALLGEAVELARRQRDSATAAHDRLVAAARRSAKLLDLTKQLAQLLEPSDSRCPLCGNEYSTPEELRLHIDGSRRPSPIDSELERARIALHTADADLQTFAIQDGRKLESIRNDQARIGVLAKQRAELKSQDDRLMATLTGLPMAEEGEEPAAARSALVELRQQEKVAIEGLFTIESRIRSVEVSRNDLLRESQSLDAQETVTLESCEAALVDARQAVAEANEVVEATLKGLEALRAEQAVIEAATADARAHLATLDGRLTAEHERKAHLLEDFRRQCSEMGIRSDVDFDSIRAELDRRVVELRAAIDWARRTIVEGNVIERRLAGNEDIVKQREQQRRLSEARGSLSELRRAVTRFQDIAKKLEARSVAEASAAGAQHSRAIQDCVNDLYPHRHLNEIEVDFSEGDLLVKDRWLSAGVHPEHYSSTGQSNVLALSVFLGLALRQTFSRAAFLLLDEPVQNLDDLHFLAFLTLIKRIALTRQVIVSTADSNVAEIFRKQLRSWAVSDRRWSEYEWVSFDPLKGPKISDRQIRRIAAA